MRDSFSKYAWPEGQWPSWEILDPCNPGSTLIPDAILEAFHRGLCANGPLTLDFPSLHDANIEHLKHGRWTSLETLGFGEAALSDLKPEYGLLAAQELRTTNRLGIDTSSFHSWGMCNDAGIIMGLNGDIGSPVYMTHELGHFTELNHPNRLQPRFCNKNVVELQAFLAQQAGYDLLMRLDEDTARQARLHRLGEGAYIYRSLVKGQAALGLVNKKPLPQITAEIIRSQWVSAAGATEIARSVYNNDVNERTDYSIINLHHHGFAGLLSLTMYDRFKTYEPEKRAEALRTLYESGPGITLQKVLDAFDLRTTQDFEKAGRRAMALIAEDIRILRPHVYLSLNP